MHIPTAKKNFTARDLNNLPCREAVSDDISGDIVHGVIERRDHNTAIADIKIDVGGRQPRARCAWNRVAALNCGVFGCARVRHRRQWKPSHLQAPPLRIGRLFESRLRGL
jgi:hypothetical protein